ncbi:hypothetical protein LTR37_002528 [Vermiconidia calcicola]|uniref:Uncharacterized protein n=1 Tax=Vermiconidia calcicola TaxID=1690605 RepID=A0ACC3NT25_9PEZI|nr:hypothetical protein LTR37_002528 [Vermiconidia calcicola]
MSRSFAISLALLCSYTTAKPLLVPGLIARQDVATTVVSAETTTAAPTITTLPTGVESCVVTTPLSTSFYEYTDHNTDGLFIATATLPPTPYCSCGSLQAGLLSSINSKGATIFSCATEGDPTPISTRLPEAATPGDPNNDGWADVTCDYGSLTSVSNDHALQWNDSGSSAAYADGVASWEAQFKPYEFDNFLADFFHARPSPNCHTLQNPNCEVTINCGQGDTPNAPTSSPAGYIIFNSMVALHTVLDNAYSGVLDAATPALAIVGNFVSSFSPIEGEIKEQQKLKLTLDAVMAGLYFGIAPGLHLGLTALKVVQKNPNNFATGVDATYGLMGSAFAAAKDAMEALSPLPVQNEIAELLGNTTEKWQRTLQDMTTRVFTDPALLLSFIDNGQTFATSIATTPIDAQVAVKKALLAASLPAAWSSGSDKVMPVILTDAGRTQEGTGCRSWQLPENTDVTDEGGFSISEEAVTNGLICDGDRAYWLMGMRVKPGQCLKKRQVLPSVSCFPQILEFETLQGLTELDGGSRWAGLKKDEIALNVIRSWQENGNKNGAAPLSGAVDDSKLERLINGDLTAATGLVPIPVCSFEEARSAAYADPENEAQNLWWPCPAP